ncbi:MAG TPA: TetR/AcrR family transcriptional regulator [Candidatus Dormibacteraeota bacterium]|nr:TetR/AcrR family transcriptional regulator [Candidatus Dormibacteraeota bacterium]
MDIAIDCFARYGYQGASIDRIAKAAGLTKGAIYYHFKDKEELLFTAVKNRVGQFERRVTSDIGAVKDAVAALRRVTDVCLEHATKSNHRRLIVILMVEALGTNARLSAQFRDMMRRFRAFLRGIIEVGQRQGIFRADVSAATAAGVYAGAVMGAEIEYYQDPTAIDLCEHLQTFLDSYLTWLASPAKAPARKRRP